MSSKVTFTNGDGYFWIGDRKFFKYNGKTVECATHKNTPSCLVCGTGIGPFTPIPNKPDRFWCTQHAPALPNNTTQPDVGAPGGASEEEYSEPELDF